MFRKVKTFYTQHGCNTEHKGMLFLAVRSNIEPNISNDHFLLGLTHASNLNFHSLCLNYYPYFTHLILISC